MRILIIRHGDPDYEKDSLTQKGWHEAELLADKMEKTDVTAFYVSPLGRTLQALHLKGSEEAQKLIIGSGNFTRRYMTKIQKSSAVRGILCLRFSLKRMTFTM